MNAETTNDGLTRAERAESAARWRAGAGAPVTQDEANQFRAAKGMDAAAVELLWQALNGPPTVGQ